MASWISVYSQFTQEALLFQSLAIFILSCGYAAFWILRKRRFGVAGEAIPSGVVKTYLNELIRDAETMRAQLFGLLRAAGVNVDAPDASSTTLVGSADSALIQKIAVLEAKMGEQARAMDSVVTEKKRIETELGQARAASGGAGGAGGDPALLAQLQEKIRQLEGRLAEYSIIEDDLANLKRLQQENAQLRASLQGAGITAPVAASPAGAAAPQPAAAPAAAQEPMLASSPPAPSAVEAAMTEPMVQPTPPPGGASAAASPGFEGLVDQVEQSLQATEAPAAVEAVAEAMPPADVGDKSDADLVAEFEKMLKA